MHPIVVLHSRQALGTVPVSRLPERHKGTDQFDQGVSYTELGCGPGGGVLVGNGKQRQDIIACHTNGHVFKIQYPYDFSVYVGIFGNR